VGYLRTLLESGRNNQRSPVVPGGGPVGPGGRWTGVLIALLRRGACSVEWSAQNQGKGNKERGEGAGRGGEDDDDGPCPLPEDREQPGNHGDRSLR